MNKKLSWRKEAARASCHWIFIGHLMSLDVIWNSTHPSVGHISISIGHWKWYHSKAWVSYSHSIITFDQRLAIFRKRYKTGADPGICVRGPSPFRLPLPSPFPPSFPSPLLLSCSLLSPPLPSSPLPSYPFPSFPSPPVRSRSLFLRIGGLGKRWSSQRVWAEPGRQTVFWWLYG